MTQLLLIDADTLLYSSASKEEIRKCKATHTPTNRTKVFPSKTAFNNWLAENPKWDKEDFVFAVEQELVGEIAFACASVRNKIDKVLEAVSPKDFKVCIQGEGNFRKFKEAKYVTYKGQRTAKPLLYQDVYDYVKRKYKNNLIISEGEETDDVLTIEGWKHWNENKGESLIIAACDKDIQANVPGYFFNYLYPDEGVVFNDPISQAKKYWTQVLIGDTADNIPGISHLHRYTKEKYGIKTNNCGKVAAAKILCEVGSEKECAQRVIEAYKLSWPDTWYDTISEMCFFLWLRRHEGDMFEFDSHVLNRLGISV